MDLQKIILQSMIDNANKQQKLESSKEYSLGSLISDLKELNKDLEVRIDDQSFPASSLLDYAEDGNEQDNNCESVFSSWRGSYCELAMQYSDDDQHITVGQLLEMAEFVNGKYLYGYKGGDFLMDLDTPIHIANYGYSGNLKLIGIEEKEGIAVLKTRDE